MFQILFHVPFTEGLAPPNGVPVPGFGVMLSLTFVLTAMVWGPLRGRAIGLGRDRVQDLAIVFFFAGFAGARVVYMVQYRDQFPDQSLLGLAASFVRFDRGGIVLYGALIGGFLGYLVFYRTVLRRLKISGWKVADMVAPLVALGIALGRIGCYLNGCCWGQPVCEECQPVPLSGTLGQFPLLPAHARDQVCRPNSGDAKRPEIHGLQTSTGFSLAPASPGGDPRGVVQAVEPDSPAARAGVKPGDRVVEVNGQPNRVLLDLYGAPELVKQATDRATKGGGEPDGPSRVAFADPAAFAVVSASLLPLRQQGLQTVTADTLDDAVRTWRELRKGGNRLSLVLERGGERVPVVFVPATVSFFPTQLYEVVSMTLLILVLLAFQPYRRHDGQLMVLAMLGYAAHRFLNEAIRIEPTYALGLTLSQWISVGIAAAALLIEAYLRATSRPLPPGPQPLGAG